MSFTKWNHLGPGEWIIAVIVFIAALATVFTSRHSRLYSDSAITVPVETVLLIDDQIELEPLLEILDESGFEYDREELLWASGIMGWRRFNRGRYEFEGSVSYENFLTKLALGLQDPMPLRVPAGASKDALKERIASQMHFDAGELSEAMQDTSFLNRYDLEAHQVYGRMLPDTYEVYWTSAPGRILERLFAEFDRRVTNAHAERLDELGRSADEIATLASIIEWEARYDHEKAAISGLYWNRLNQRWRLQADPTVNYAKGERSRLVYADYRMDHPYNTYLIYGLPPGPITNPSYSSIEAALFPEEHDYMFMVATPEGTHSFSRTYAEHRRKSREWTDWLRDQRRQRAIIEREEAFREEALKEEELREEQKQAGS